MSARSHFHFSDDVHPWVIENNFEDVSSASFLEFLAQKKTSKADSREPAFLLDIDSTLFGLGLRFRSIFMAFLRQHPNPPLWAQKAVPRINAFNHHYSLQTAVLEMVPKELRNDMDYQSTIRSFGLELRDFWETHFFSERHLHYDTPYPGALEFVRALEAQNIRPIYLTGRDRIRKGSGTLQTLKRFGFIHNEHALLYMKPSIEEFDVVFKKRVAETLKQQFNVLGVVDNEPENLVVFSKILPQSEIVFFHSIMSPRLPKEKIKNFLGPRKLFRLKGF
jgi:hypothetical protein